MRVIRSAVIVWIVLTPAVLAADYYPLREGNLWTYTMSNGMQMIAKVTGFADVGAVRCAIVETTLAGQTSREYLAADAQGLKTYMGQAQGQESRYDPPVVRIKLPYKDGDAWTAIVNQLGMTVNTTSQSIGQEQVQTPAGTFDCIKVRTTAATMPPMVSTIYYAQGIGPVRQVIQMVGQELTATLASTNVKPAQEAPAAPAPATSMKVRCPKCSADLPAGAKFCPACGEKITAPATTAEPSATEASPTADPNQPGLEKYQSPDGKILLYKPKGWAVNQGDMFGQGTYAVTVMEPQENAVVLFITFPLTAEIKDSVVLAAKCIAALREKYPDLQATSLNSTPDRARTLANISLTDEGEKGQGHGYFFHTQNTGSVYILLAKAQKWNELRPTLTTVAANLAYAPQGVAAVQEQGKQLAEQAPTATEGSALSPAAILKQASQRPGKQVTLQPATLPDQSLSVQIPQGWTIEGQKIQFVAVNDPQTRTHGAGYVSHTIIPMDIPVQGVITASYQPPPQALDLVLQFGRTGRDLQILSECPAEQAVPELTQAIQQMRAQGFQVDARLIHARFRNVATGAICRGLFTVQCSIRSMTPVWQVSVQGSWAPDNEYDDWVPVYLRMGRSAKVNEQWLGREMQNRAVAQQQQFRNLQNSIAESNRAFDSYMDTVRDGSRSRDYIGHMWSQTTLGQGSWVAENEGAKVYHTDSWGIEGPEGRIDSPAYNTTNFTGENPWTGRDLELIDTRAEYERYIANP